MAADLIRKLVDGEHLTREEAYNAVMLLIDGAASPAQIGAILVAMRMKGETVDEVTGFAQGMRERVVAVRSNRRPLLDTCGTGGSRFRVFNVSTAAAFVACAAGISVAKHGNRGVTSACGSADVLEALGVRVGLTSEQCAACIDTVGIGFIYAIHHHPAMKNVSVFRREIGVRSIFNLIGPLTNPAGASHQVVGVYSAHLCTLASGALLEMGSERAIVVHGQIGLDEISTIGDTFVSELRDGRVENYTITPRELGFAGPEPRHEYLAPTPDVAANGAIVREALSGAANSAAARARRDLVAANAGASLRAMGLADSWPAAVEMAQGILASGSALRALDALAEFTQTVP